MSDHMAVHLGMQRQMRATLLGSAGRAPSGIAKPTRIEVHLVRKKPDGQECIRVRLQSMRYPQISSDGYVPTDKDRLEHAVGICAGAVAEHQCEMYRDEHDPDVVAREAMRMFRKLRDGEPQRGVIS